MQKKILKLLESLQPISAESTMFFIQHLGVMVKAGLSLHDALTTLAEEVEGKRFQGIIQDVARGVAQGKTLADNLARYPRVFSELFVNMVKSGEVSGKLEETLKELHLELAKDHTLRSKVRGALIYPTVIICVMIAITIFMMTVVMPRLISIFDEIHAPLPLATQVVIAISKFITAHGILVVLAALCVSVGTILFLRHPKGKALFHRGMLSFPILGGIVRKINLARFARTLSSLLKTDI
ncbi:type II secretion system F family protein, partial [Candidatus Uhrbacteria bacterium]|nr:type II secretion system F family protein [Candidatus Uhrbacteria bacterium]